MVPELPCFNRCSIPSIEWHSRDEAACQDREDFELHRHRCGAVTNSNWRGSWSTRCLSITNYPLKTYWEWKSKLSSINSKPMPKILGKSLFVRSATNSAPTNLNFRWFTLLVKFNLQVIKVGIWRTKWVSRWQRQMRPGTRVHQSLKRKKFRGAKRVLICDHTMLNFIDAGHRKVRS